MEPITAILGVSALGYLLSKNKNNEKFNNIENFESNINPSIENYPWNHIEQFGETEQLVEKEKTLNPSPLSTSFINSPSNIEALNNAGDPPADYFLNANKRSVEDFTVGNMVPFFSGSSTKQDMRGTGVSQANVNSDNFNLGNDNSTSNYATLATFTGIDDTYLHKRETPNFFSPNERRDRSTIPGEDASAQRPIRDRYTTSLLTKNDEKPFESIMVGPGLNIEANMPNDGQGYNSGLTNRVMPSNVGAYKLTQHSGRITGTNWQGAMNPTALPGSGPSFKEGKTDSMYGVPSKNKTPYYTLDDRPLTGTPANTQAPMNYSAVILPSGTDKRTTTNVQFGDSIEISK